MCKRVAIFSIAILALDVSVAVEGEGTKFEQVQEGDTTDVATDERIIIRDEDEILILQFLEPTNTKTGDVQIESCTIQWLLISRDEVNHGEVKSSITYRVEKRTDGDHLEQIEGDQEINIGAFSLEWSWASRGSVWVYFLDSYSYAKVQSVPTKQVEKSSVSFPNSQPLRVSPS